MNNLDFSLDPKTSILHVRELGEVTAEGFAGITQVVDAYIEANGDLAGIIIESPSFPGWESFNAFLSHFRFVRDYHLHVRKIGIVTDSAMGGVAEYFAAFFISAEIRHFPSSDPAAAERWILTQS